MTYEVLSVDNGYGIFANGEQILAQNILSNALFIKHILEMDNENVTFIIN